MITKLVRSFSHRANGTLQCQRDIEAVIVLVPCRQTVISETRDTIRTASIGPEKLQSYRKVRMLYK